MAVITFSFDDGDSSWIRASKILEKYGYRGTFNVTLRNVVPDIVKTRPEMFPVDQVLHKDQVIWLYKRGHEIASHGLRHLEPSRCNSVELWYELRASRNILQSYDDVKVTSFACPFNGFNQDVEKASRGVYRSIRGRPGYNRIPVKGRVYHGLDPSRYGQIIGKAVNENLWAVLVWHKVDPVDFEKVVSYVDKRKVRVKRVCDVV